MVAVGVRAFSQRPLRTDMLGNVAVKDPVAFALRHPGHRHRRPGVHQLGDNARFPVGVERDVALTVAERVDGEIEPVQVHRMRLRAEIQDAPAHFFAEAIREAFGRRPGEAVDHERESRVQREERAADIIGVRKLCELGARQAGPVGDDQDTIRASGLAGRIDDECTRQLRIVHRSEWQRHARRRGPVVVGARTAGAETHRALTCRRDLDRWTWRSVASAQSVDFHRMGEIVSDARGDLGAFGNPEEWGGDQQGTRQLAERLNLHRRSILAFGTPATCTRPQFQCKRPRHQATGGALIVVDRDAGQVALADLTRDDAGTGRDRRQDEKRRRKPKVES